MRRREFLIAAAAAAGLARTRRGWASTPAQNANRADPAKLARIAIMTLNFSSILKVPGQETNPDRTLDIMDLPQMYADRYGVHNIEFQHSHILSTETSYLKDLRATIEKSKSRMTQINLEFGAMNISAADPALRVQAIDLTKRWIDHSVILGRPNVMINQGQPTHENKVYGIPTLRTMGEYGKSKGVKVSVETRGGGGGRGRGAAAGTAPGAAPPPPPPAPTGPPAWVLLAEIIKAAGVYSNPDMGGIGAPNQEVLHAALRAMFPMTSGSTHTRVNTNWDLATAVKFLENELGYKGLYTIEVNGHEGTQRIYDIVLANI